MQNKVVVCSSKQNLTADCLGKIEESLLQRGFFDYSFSTCSSFDNLVCVCKTAKNSIDNTIVICEDKMIDKLLEEIKESDDKFSYVNEQSIKLEKTTTYRKMLFIPIELEIDKFLDLFLEKKESYVCSFFGKNQEFVNEKFDEIKTNFEDGFDYVVISKSQFLHIIYYSKYVDEGLLIEHFGENVFVDFSKPLTEKLEELLISKNLKLSVADNLTFGLFSGKLFENSKQFASLLKRCVILNNDESFKQMLLDKQFLDNNGTVSKETAFELTKNLLRDDGVDIAVSIIGFDCEAGRSFVSVGNRQEIFVYSSVFYGDREKRLQNVINFALFKSIKFLIEKY